MFQQISRHFKANVVGYVALFLALGGASYAAWMAPPNSVNSRSIINGQVKTPDLAPNAVAADESCLEGVCYGSKEIGVDAVSSRELAPGSVEQRHIAPGAVTSNALATGSVNGRAVQDGSLTGWDIAPKSIGSAQIDEPSLAQGQAYTAYHDNAIWVDSGTNGHILHLDLPAGTYFVIGKVVAETSDSGGVDCTTYTSSTSDIARARTDDNGGMNSTLTMTTVASESAPFTLQMDCGNGTDPPAAFVDAKLTAVSVATNHVSHQ